MQHKALLTPNNKTGSPFNTLCSWSGPLLRMILFELPIVLVFAFYLSTHAIKHFHDEYLIPQLQLLHFDIPRDFTYYYRTCTSADATTPTKDTFDLVVTEDMGPAEAVDNIMTHGASIYPHLLSPETSNDLRDYILEQNKVRVTFDHIIEAENRHTWGIQVDQHPVVSKSLEEIFSHPKFRESVFTITGQDPAVLEFNHITVMYGAKAQHIHEDITWGTPLRFARNYVPHYSLFIPLQNTTKEMGATGICPGSHMCSAGQMFFCHDTGFQIFEGYDHWPAGWGFLYNQQLTHWGAAHTDPDAPQRVLLIMTFAPRPRLGDKELETRFIAEGGADFIHWSSWGHTWNDFEKPLQRMMQPWRFLKSMGIFKTPWSNWGWDYVSQSSGRITNEQPGWNREDYDDLFMKDGGIPNIPMSLQGRADDGTSTSSCWSEYMVDTLKLWSSASRWLHLGLLSVFVAGTFAANCLRRTLSVNRVGNSTIRKKFIILAIFHGIVLLVSDIAVRHIPKRSWGRHLKKGTLYQISETRLGGINKAPATLPCNHDILVPDDLQSDYLRAVRRMFDVGHPGNKKWKEIVSSISVGYNLLPASLQAQLARNAVMWSKQACSRVLAKNLENQWSELNAEDAGDFAYKELAKDSNVMINHIVAWSDYLLSETKYGYWRDTAMHTLHIPKMLQELQNRLMQRPKFNRQEARILHSQRPRRFLRLPPPTLNWRKGGHETQRSHSTGIPPTGVVHAPYNGAWLKVGDIVEGKYREQTFEWFRGVITAVSMETATWSVFYDDGDTDEQLCRRCVRPFVPYTVGEQVTFVGNSTSDLASVLATHSDDFYDLNILSTGQIVSHVHNTQTFRYEQEEHSFAVGNLVQFKHGHGTYDWNAGRIEAIGQDGTMLILDEYSRRYDQVPTELIRPDMTWYKIE